MRKKQKDDYYNLDDLKAYMSMPAKDKLIYLAEINKFLSKITPLESKRNWEELKKRGW